MRNALLAAGLRVTALAAVGILSTTTTTYAKPRINPIIFVHGGSGSAAQFETQAMRFASNGYPHRDTPWGPSSPRRTSPPPPAPRTSPTT